MSKTAYELEREANIARNRALLQQLDLKEAAVSLGAPSKSTSNAKTKAKPIQPAKKRKREDVEEVVPRRQSSRLKKSVPDVNESPEKKRKREQEEEERRLKEEEERAAAEERAKEARRPRHNDLDLVKLAPDSDSNELSQLTSTLHAICKEDHPKRVGGRDAFVYDDGDEKEEGEITSLKERLQGMKVVARAKVTQDRVYSAAYHPEVTKDIICFGDKHGQLGIWDARALPDEVSDEDEEVSPSGDAEGGKYWRLQMHWPATSKSSISCVKFDPINSHNASPDLLISFHSLTFLYQVFTSAYDCTIRSFSLTSGISRQVFSSDDILISSIDLPPAGHEMWIADALGGVTHLDLREHEPKGRWYGLSDQKIGCVSVNPVDPHLLLTASNNRSLKLWDVRKLQTLGGGAVSTLLTPPPSSPSGGKDKEHESSEYDNGQIEDFLKSKKGQGCLRGEWPHNKSVSSAYWDVRGRSIVSTSYDDTLRLWDVDPATLSRQSVIRTFKPFNKIRHNCQTGKWLTILRAQWTPNPDVYPHFTIGNMDHSLDIFSSKGDLLARLSDKQRITAVQAVTCSHPNVVERAASGNGSGRCVLWAPSDDS
ncbi:hypothetical protein JAAARDRAFT_173322 [Jaapia argillacea MUCL 33604]|uniref:DNA damage-binding protein CMR1 n=1 Tax=Jaapia argillacea MUCL 33604 TaxID=933084 RepID=A0A067Q1X3_9AGAM|nr:hypothetical protein JAAARDRAFT_173322 [Jaapia argillacea MUCL 33604]